MDVWKVILKISFVLVCYVKNSFTRHNFWKVGSRKHYVFLKFNQLLRTNHFNALSTHHQTISKSTVPTVLATFLPSFFLMSKLSPIPIWGSQTHAHMHTTTNCLNWWVILSKLVASATQHSQCLAVSLVGDDIFHICMSVALPALSSLLLLLLLLCSRRLSSVVRFRMVEKCRWV